MKKRIKLKIMKTFQGWAIYEKRKKKSSFYNSKKEAETQKSFLISR